MRVVDEGGLKLDCVKKVESPIIRRPRFELDENDSRRRWIYEKRGVTYD